MKWISGNLTFPETPNHPSVLFVSRERAVRAIHLAEKGKEEQVPTANPDEIGTRILTSVSAWLQVCQLKRMRENAPDVNGVKCRGYGFQRDKTSEDDDPVRLARVSFQKRGFSLRGESREVHLEGRRNVHTPSHFQAKKTLVVIHCSA